MSLPTKWKIFRVSQYISTKNAIEAKGGCVIAVERDGLLVAAFPQPYADSCGYELYPTRLPDHEFGLENYREMARMGILKYGSGLADCYLQLEPASSRDWIEKILENWIATPQPAFAIPR